MLGRLVLARRTLWFGRLPGCAACSACALDTARLKLRDKAQHYDAMEDATAALERQQHSVLAELRKEEAALVGRRAELNTLLVAVTHDDSCTASSSLGRSVVEAVQRRAEHKDAQGRDEEAWRAELAGDSGSNLLRAHRLLECCTNSLQARRDALRTLVDAQSYQQECTRRLESAIVALRRKVASLEQAAKRRSVRH